MKKRIKKLNLSRRNFLTGTATLAGVAATASFVPITIAKANHSEGKKGLPDFISWKDRDALIVHSDKGIETHRSAIGESLITPNRNIYIRNNMPTMTDEQIGNRMDWKVSIEGVKNPKTFTLAQLQKLGHETMATILQCSGNGRGFFKHKPRGSQWKTGAAACVLWTGVPMKTVVEACGGINGDAVFMTSAGIDHQPTGLDPKKAMIERSVPKKVFKDAMLAWEMNGVPSPAGGILVLTPLIFSMTSFDLVKVNYEIIVPIFFIVTSLLLISKFPTYSFKKIVIQRKTTIFLLFGIVLFFGLVLVYPFNVISISAIIYLLMLPISFIHYQKLKKQNKGHNNLDEDDDLEDIL